MLLSRREVDCDKPAQFWAQAGSQFPHSARAEVRAEERSRGFSLSLYHLDRQADAAQTSSSTSLSTANDHSSAVHRRGALEELERFPRVIFITHDHSFSRLDPTFEPRPYQAVSLLHWYGLDAIIRVRC